MAQPLPTLPAAPQPQQVAQPVAPTPQRDIKPSPLSQPPTSVLEAPPPTADEGGELPNHFGRLNASFSTRAFPAVHLPPSEPGVDLFAPPLLPDGRSVYDIDLDLLDRKDWRLPGADVSDWFNYGFDEFTWMDWTRKKREMEEMRNMPQQQPGMGMMVHPLSLVSSVGASPRLTLSRLHHF